MLLTLAKTTESGSPKDYNTSKKIKGRKRHVLTDTLGLLVTAVIHVANVQDRHGALWIYSKRARQLQAWATGHLHL
jgi:hypothetical protein